MTPRLMEQQDRPSVKYLPSYCPFRKQEVWAIMTQQADGAWKIVNCLDKARACFEEPCAFTSAGGDWPFHQGLADSFPLKGSPHGR